VLGRAARSGRSTRASSGAHSLAGDFSLCAGWDRGREGENRVSCAPPVRGLVCVCDQMQDDDNDDDIMG
jgi:hypothetical protein